MFDVLKIRQEFPILAKRVNDKPLVYLDNGASAQKPTLVIETIKKLL
jgi:cysteine desulfurase/selenocysteine lyase